MSSEILRPGTNLCTSNVQPFPWRRMGTASATAYAAGPDVAQHPSGAAVRADEETSRRELEQVRQEGFRCGEAEASLASQTRVDELMTKLNRTICEIAAYRPRLRREAEEDVVKLSLAIARRIVGRELTVDPDIILALVKTGVQKLDARDIQTVRAHPDDAARIKSYLVGSDLPRRIEVDTDSSLERGAIVFTTSRGTLDLSVNTQLSEIERGFTDVMKRNS